MVYLLLRRKVVLRRAVGGVQVQVQLAMPQTLQQRLLLHPAVTPAQGFADTSLQVLAHFMGERQSLWPLKALKLQKKTIEAKAIHLGANSCSTCMWCVCVPCVDGAYILFMAASVQIPSLKQAHIT